MTALLPAVAVEASNLSQQLGLLRRAGIVSARRQGDSVTYSIASAHVAELLTVARTVLSWLLNEQIDALERSTVEMS